MVSFEELGLSKQVLASIKEVGFTEPTEIQAKTIGIVTQGKDLIASAQTGSGKTAAYVLPIIDKLRADDKANRSKTRALIIVPTRELAMQVKDEFERFAKDTGLKAVALYGGVGYRQQVQSLHRGADVIVATPGRLLDCANRNYANLSKIQILVLDEADRLLDMGFMPQVRAVVARIPQQRQTLMFSATIDSRMKKIAEEFLQSPVVVAANDQKIEPSSIEQQFHYIKESEKEGMLLTIIEAALTGSVLVFTRTKRKATFLTARLRNLEVKAEEIHGDIGQGQRTRTLDRFRRGDFNVLVATDVAARGLDVPSISHVVNYDLPMLAEDYVHRIGRTGRAGRAGVAHSFVSADQKHLIQGIHLVMKNRTGSDKTEKSAPRGNNRREFEARAYAVKLATGNSSDPSQSRNSQSRYGRSANGSAKPAYGTGRPAYGEGRPAYGEGKPTYGDRKPASGEVKSAYGDRKPAYGDRKPTYGEGKPAYGDRKPAYSSAKSGPARKPSAAPHQRHKDSNQSNGRRNRDLFEDIAGIV